MAPMATQAYQHGHRAHRIGPYSIGANKGHEGPSEGLGIRMLLSSTGSTRGAYWLDSFPWICCVGGEARPEARPSTPRKMAACIALALWMT